ncbi:carboxylesterase/lipase family protein [Amycolatopsis azurea]|uniref:Carboxylic ester hydrolase n=1 Tax=Amycolatopsis azurea DSM 43854 TaxID=1238180 RepID=M2PLM6_9PSEU|nr:carboxylesterase family protein [Amycolatopsis azurea]EMD25408.1 carboxylesterase, type B [Amycolatopsis azurea DSM 43854]OOC00580.1 carboxylesterase, type B [Amycolatopsis azurea DSM 43854]
MRFDRKVVAAVAATVLIATPLTGSVSMAGEQNKGDPPAPVCSTGTTVKTDDGPVCGVTAAGVTSWQGIRYGAPPTGELRWKAPRRPAPWTETFAATTEGNQCPQPASVGPGTDNEDCLNLTVRAPAKLGPGPLAVMVQIHGGGFLLLKPQDASRLVTGGNVISVEVNYRLGIFGFLAHEGFGEHAGNYGLLDQQAALRWVQRNISRFGGDPRNVTIYGASAGGSSVCAHTAAPSSAGLFQRGIAQSGEYNSLLGVDTVWQAQDCKAKLPTEEQAQRTGAKFAAALGCGVAAEAAACLRKAPAAAVLKQADHGREPANGTVAPIVDGKFLPMSPGEAFATGHVNDVALIHGVDRDETQLPFATTPADYENLVRQQYGEHAPAVRRTYPLKRFPAPAPFLAYRTIVADSNSVCPSMLNTERLAKHIPVFAYQFDDTDVPPQFFLDPTKPNGAYHIAEMLLLLPGGNKLTPNQQVLSDQLLTQWTGFARTGNPTVDGAPRWDPYSEDDPVVMSLNAAGDSQLTTEIPRQHHCEKLWDPLTPFNERR